MNTPLPWPEFQAVPEKNFEIHSAIFNALPDCFAVIDRAGNILEVNDAWRKLAAANMLPGVELDIGQNYLDLSSHSPFDNVEDLRAMVQGIRRVLKGEQPDFVHEYPARAHGQPRWYRLRAAPLRTAGAFPRAVLVCSDITQAREAEESLRQAEFKYRSIYENATEGIYQTSAAGHYISANPMLAKIYGYDSPAELIQSIKSIAHQLYVEPLRRAEFVRTMEKRDVVFQFESAIRRKDGQVIWISENARAVRDPHGALLYYEGTVEDITDLKKAQEQIRSQAALLDKARDAILVWDLHSRILYWNHGAERIFGWDTSEALGRDVRDLIYRDQATFEKAIATGLAEGGWSGEMQLARKDGTPVIIETSLTLVRDPDGEPKSILAINTDVTEKKRLQEQVVHAHRLDSIGTLAGGIAHDFNNILSIINGYTQLGRTSVPANHPIQRNLAAIENSTERAVGVVRQILTFSRQQATQRDVINLQPVVEEALQFLRTTLPAKIEIRSEFAPELPSILADATQIHQIVMNLGTNAAHAMRKNGGLLDVRASAVVLDQHSAVALGSLPLGRYLCLEVRDTGCGMDQATLQRIFEPFFTTKVKGEGTGLGMAVVHGIMKSHDGAITVASEPAQGTVFHLYFPAVESKPDASTPNTSKNPFGHGRRILYVDDEEELVFLAIMQLQQQGFKITGFSDPIKALDTFCANPQDFDCAVIDVSMPRIDGPELARQLLSIRPNFPIAMITGFMQPDDAEKVRALGVKKVIDKTTSFKRLGVILEQFLNDS